MTTCVLVGIYATHLWIGGMNQMVTVCEYRCPKMISTVQFAVGYGSDCSHSKLLPN